MLECLILRDDDVGLRLVLDNDEALFGEGRATGLPVKFAAVVADWTLLLRVDDVIDALPRNTLCWRVSWRRWRGNDAVGGISGQIAIIHWGNNFPLLSLLLLGPLSRWGRVVDDAQERFQLVLLGHEAFQGDEIGSN